MKKPSYADNFGWKLFKEYLNKRGIDLNDDVALYWEFWKNGYKACGKNAQETEVYSISKFIDLAEVNK
jgi:hypothetical protein